MADHSPWDDPDMLIHQQPSMNQSINHQSAAAFYESINQSSINQSINQSQSPNSGFQETFSFDPYAYQPTDQPTYQPPINQPTNQPIIHSNDHSLILSFNQSTNQSTNQSFDDYPHKSDDDVTEDHYGNELVNTNQFLRRLIDVLMVESSIPDRSRQIDDDAEKLSRIIRLTTRSINMKYIAQCHKQRLQSIQAQFDHEHQLINQQRQEIKARRDSLIERSRLMHQHLVQTLQHRELIDRCRSSYFSELETSSLRSTVVLSVRHRSIIDQLMSIYPIQLLPPPLRTPDDTFAIRGCKLPNVNINQSDDETSSTALSYVAHLLILLSAYFDVPLRYRLVYRSSRSLIADEFVSHSMFPLYIKGAERDKLETGLMLLNNDIDQLMHACMNSARMKSSRRAQFNQAARLASKQVHGRGHQILERLKHLTDILMILG